jgi:tetratricopeptide (TPR) repeat protein
MRTKLSPGYCISLVLCLSLLLCAPAQVLGGEKGSGVKAGQAKELVDKAQVLYSYGDYKGALENYVSAYELVQDNMLHYEIGLCCMKLGEWAGAAAELEKYVVGEGGSIDPQMAEEISVLLEDITKKIGVIYLTVETAGAEISVDGASCGKAPLQGGIFVDPGEHEIEVSAEGLEWRKSLEIKAGETMELEVKKSDLSLPGQGQGASVPAGPKPEKKGKRIGRSYAYAALSLTLASLACAAITGGLALKDANELEDLDRQCEQDVCYNNLALHNEYAANKNDVYSRADAEAKASTALFAVSGAFALATILLFVFSRPVKEAGNGSSSGKISTSFLPGAEGLALKVNF